MSALDNELESLESMLRTLLPVPGALDPISAAYRAGRRSTRTTLLAWQTSLGIMALATAASWFSRPGVPIAQPVRDEPVAVRQPAEPAPMSPADPQSIAVLEQQMFSDEVAKPPQSLQAQSHFKPIYAGDASLEEHL
jgi:hypothetical protein